MLELNEVVGAPGQFVSFSPVAARQLPLTFGAPAVTNIDTTVASFGVRLIADGGVPAESWGTVFDTSPAPTANLAVQTGSASAPYDVLLPMTSLAPGGHYYVRAFASNAVDQIVWSPDAEFYSEPMSDSGISFPSVSNSMMRISWTAGAGSAGHLVLVRQGAPVTAVPTDGVQYSANAVFGQGNDLGGGTYVVYAGATSSATVANLRRGSNYSVAVFSYAGSGSLINYQQDSPAVGTQNTATRPQAGR